MALINAIPIVAAATAPKLENNLFANCISISTCVSSPSVNSPWAKDRVQNICYGKFYFGQKSKFLPKMVFQKIQFFFCKILTTDNFCGKLF